MAEVEPLPLATNEGTATPSQLDTGRSEDVAQLLGDVDTDLDKLGQLLGVDGAVRRKASKRVKRAFGVTTSKQLSDALAVALQAQAKRHEAELSRVREEGKRDLDKLRADLEARIDAMNAGLSPEEAALEAERRAAREARLVTIESRLDALAHNLSGFADNQQRLAKQEEERAAYREKVEARAEDKPAPVREQAGEDLGYGFRTDGTPRNPAAMQRWHRAFDYIRSKSKLKHYGAEVRCAPRHSVANRLADMEKTMMELKTHIEYLEHQEAPVVVSGDSGEALQALSQKLERCFDRVAAAENSIDTTNEALGIAREQLAEAQQRSAELAAQSQAIEQSLGEFNDELSVTKTQLGSQIDTTKTQLDVTKTQLGEQIGEFNDELSVTSTALGALTAVKHDTFAENILTLVAENAARLGLTGGEGAPPYNDQPLTKRVETLEETVAGHAAHFEALDAEAQRARDSTELQDLLGRVVEVENSIGTTNEALGIAKEQLHDSLNQKSQQLNAEIASSRAQLGEQIDTTKTQLGEQVSMVDKQLGEAQNKLEGFNDDLSVQTEAVATLTAVKHDAFAQNILDLVAENAARLGLIGNAPQKVDERALQRKFMEGLATMNLVQAASDDTFTMSDGVKRAVDFVDAETQDATARSKCDELSTSIEQLEAALKEAVAARDAALRQESSERRKQDKLQTKERAKDAIQARDAAVAAAASYSAVSVALAGENAESLVDARMAAALEVISRDMLKGSGVLGDRVSAVEKTANEALSTANKVDNGVPLLINDQKKREKELWDFCRSELCRSGWFEERLNRLATAVDQKPDEARVKMLLRKLDATLRMHCGDGAALSLLVERIHGEVSRKLNRKDVIRIVEASIDECEKRLEKVAKAGGGARINAFLHDATLPQKGLPPGATSSTLGRTTTLARPRTSAQLAQTAIKPDAAKEIFSAIAQSVTESMGADLTSVQTGVEPAPLKEAARWAASAASAAVLGLAIQDVERLSTTRGPTTQPVLFPGQTRALATQGRPATATTPGFTAPPFDPNLVKRTFDSPPNQLVLASYPNGRPGALRPISLAPPEQEDDYEDVPIAEPYVQPSAMPSGAMSPLSQGPAD
jgi:hypothetical protein